MGRCNCRRWGSLIVVEHPFVKLARTAQSQGRYWNSTIFDADYLSEEKRQAYIQESAEALNLSVEEYKETVAYRREILAEFVTDTNMQVISSWTDARERSAVMTVPRPKWFKAYTAMDLGAVDATGVVFGYWHNPSRSIVVEDELLIRGYDSTNVTRMVLAKEKELWGDQTPELRVADAAGTTLADLNAVHGLEISDPSKDRDKHWGIDRVNRFVNGNQLKVHPRCLKLIHQLQTTVWSNAMKKKWGRNKDGHADLLDALIYFVKNVSMEDPVPPGEGLTYEEHDYRGEVALTQSEQDLLNIFRSPFD